MRSRASGRCVKMMVEAVPGRVGPILPRVPAPTTRAVMRIGGIVDMVLEERTLSFSHVVFAVGELEFA